jgi:hypothetical protein
VTESWCLGGLTQLDQVHHFLALLLAATLIILFFNRIKYIDHKLQWPPLQISVLLSLSMTLMQTPSGKLQDPSKNA